MDAALSTRLAYVVTGDAAVDETSKQGLIGLTRVLASRTSAELAEPIAVNPARDELAFYPLIYWPIVAGQSQPQPEARTRIAAYMKNGGTVVFDTRDALISHPGGAADRRGALAARAARGRRRARARAGAARPCADQDLLSP